VVTAREGGVVPTSTCRLRGRLQDLMMLDALVTLTVLAICVVLVLVFVCCCASVWKDLVYRVSVVVLALHVYSLVQEAGRQGWVHVARTLLAYTATALDELHDLVANVTLAARARGTDL
jgi:hypothetical protein